MKWNKKSQGSSIPGFSTVVAWVIVIALGIVLMIILFQSTEVGKTAWNSIKEMFVFA